MDLGLRGKRALVMGSSTGIGRAIAETLVHEGARVCLSSRDEGKLIAAARAMKADCYFACDFSKAGSTRELVNKVIQKLGGLDILVTNTGGPSRGNFLEISDGQWLEDYQSLWMSAVDAMQVALPQMKTQGYGRVLMVTSVSAKETLPRLTSSNALRAGLKGLAKSISNEYAGFGVTVNVLMPGYTDTERLRELNLTQDRIKQMIPAGRLGKPEELAALAAFLSSPQAAYITGQSIAVDGGFLRSH